MSVTLTGIEGFFTRHGAWIGEYNRVAALYGSALDVGFQSIWSQYGSSDQAAVQQLPDAVTAFRQTGAGYQSVLVADGILSSRLQVGRDTSVIPDTFARAINIISEQMEAAAASINRPTVTLTPTAGVSNLGDTEFFVSNVNIYGDPLDMTVAETVTATCTSQGSGFASTWNVLGEVSVPPSSWNWPQGSGAQVSVTAIDPAADGTITNGDFSSFTVANTPDDWTIINGAAGTTVFQSVSGGVRTGTDAVYLQSDGSQATRLVQEVSLSINTVYAVTFQARINSTDAAGGFIIALTDDTGTVLTNDAGDNLQLTLNLNGEIDASYDLFTVFFSTPKQLPSVTQLRVGYETAPTSGRQLFLDLIQIVTPTALYGASGTGTRGPWIVAVSNTDPSAIGDTYSIVATNSLTPKSFVMGMQRLYDMQGQGIYIPSSTSPTIPDSLVTH